MKKYIVFAFICLILTACTFKTAAVKDKDETEINVIKEKIETAEKEIRLLMEINAEIIYDGGKKADDKIWSKKSVRETRQIMADFPDAIVNEDEIVENSERIYVLMDRIKEWNEKLNRLCQPAEKKN